MSREIRWRYALENLKICLPENYLIYIQFENKNINEEQLKSNINWINILLLINTNGIWSHLIILKYFEKLKSKPNLIINRQISKITNSNIGNIIKNNSIDMLGNIDKFANENLKIENYLNGNMENNEIDFEYNNKNKITQGNNIEYKDNEIICQIPSFNYIDKFINNETYLLINKGNNKIKFLKKYENLDINNQINKQYEIIDDIIYGNTIENYGIEILFKNINNTFINLYRNWKEILNKIKTYNKNIIIPSDLLEDDYKFMPNINKNWKNLKEWYNYKIKNFRRNKSAPKDKYNPNNNGIRKYIYNMRYKNNKEKEKEIINNKNNRNLYKSMENNDLEFTNKNINERQIFIWNIQEKYAIIQENINLGNIKFENYNEEIKEILIELNNNNKIKLKINK